VNQEESEHNEVDGMPQLYTTVHGTINILQMYVCNVCNFCLFRG